MGRERGEGGGQQSEFYRIICITGEGYNLEANFEVEFFLSFPKTPLSRPEPNWIWRIRGIEHTDTETCAVGVASVIFHDTEPHILLTKHDESEFGQVRGIKGEVVGFVFLSVLFFWARGREVGGAALEQRLFSSFLSPIPFFFSIRLLLTRGIKAGFGSTRV